ncbi:hypothetical protein L596_028703 [Steinernema carpocapsae]|uniref:Uncharacterized protein n=1 Tax=Steinernema carpocapsae TaxID=34508 RepID=A0A4U5LZ95_STECR|nr:hypothetical protein L596_028703 [Steinernema carpocapsae]
MPENDLPNYSLLFPWSNRNSIDDTQNSHANYENIKRSSCYPKNSKAAIFLLSVLYGSISTLVLILSFLLGDFNARFLIGSVCVAVVASSFMAIKGITLRRRKLFIGLILVLVAHVFILFIYIFFLLENLLGASLNSYQRSVVLMSIFIVVSHEVFVIWFAVVVLEYVICWERNRDNVETS